LERYGFASPREFSFVEILAGDYEPAERIALPDRPLMPNQATNFPRRPGRAGIVRRRACSS
jgi:hypothetical protein